MASGGVQQGLPVLVVIAAALGVEIVRPLHRDAVAALALDDGPVEVPLAVAVVVAGEELDLLPVLVPGLGHPQIDAVFLLEGRLLRGIVDQILAIDEGHRVVVERQHVEHAVDAPDQVHELGHVDVDIDPVAGGEIVERHQPAGLGELADPVEVDHDQVVAALGRDQLRHQLRVHVDVADGLDLDVDARRFLEFRHQLLDVTGVRYRLHQDADGFRLRHARKEHGCGGNCDEQSHIDPPLMWSRAPPVVAPGRRRRSGGCRVTSAHPVKVP